MCRILGCVACACAKLDCKTCSTCAEENDGCCAVADPGDFAKNPQEQHTKAYGHSIEDCLCTVKGVSSTYVGRCRNKKISRA
jgi:hypothetical protein